jgi:uncharacterized protein
MKYVVRLLVASLFLALGVCNASAAKTVPGNSSRLQVLDEAHLLSYSEQRDLRKSLRVIEKDTGAQVAVLTVKSLEGDDLKGFALNVARKWALGQRGKNNGVLVLYAQDQNALRIEVGTGLEGALPDGKAGDIVRAFRKDLVDKKGYAKAFGTVVEEISNIVYKEADVSVKSTIEEGKNMGSSDKSFFLYGLATLLSGILGAVFWSKTLRYVPGGLLGSASWAFIGYHLVGPDAVIALALLGFVVTIIVSFFLRHGGDTFGIWPGPGSGGGDGIGGMGSGGGDFAGGGADAIGGAIGDIIGGIFGS